MPKESVKPKYKDFWAWLTNKTGEEKREPAGATVEQTVRRVYRVIR